MADRRLRELERTFAETGTLEAEVALLGHRVRTGDLHAAWLETAARLGHKASRQLIDGFLPVLTWADLAERLPAWGGTANALAQLGTDDLTSGAEARQRDAAKRARAALIPWALANGHGADPPTWPDDGQDQVRPADPLARRAAEAAFLERAAQPAVQAQAKLLRKRRKAGTLKKERLDVAADLAHPAAWVVSRRKRLPDLRLLGAGSALPRRLNEILQAYAQPTRRRTRAYRDRGGELVVHSNDGDKPWPDWGGALAIRIGIALAEHVLPTFEAQHPDESRPRAAIEAAADYLACPCAEHVDAARRAFRAAQSVVKATRALRPQAAARAAAAVAQLAGRALKAWNPGLGEGTYDLTLESERAGADPEALWQVAREAGASWALGEDEPSSERRYSPQARFVENEAITHPTFGVGVVRVVRGAKIDVEFEEAGVKTLVHKG